MTEEEHMLGKAIMGIIAMVLTLLLIGFFILGKMADKDVPSNYLDDVVNEETKNIV
tara:strand:- start:2256 stop:2423 length:168 start_codon:yes stop_codon:yes gene_type:complete